jgi:ABC-type cobalt transport system substrate-binding protein
MIYSLIKLIGHRNLGFILGFVVVLNLAIGSLVMNIYAELYPPFFPFDLNYFFNPIKIEHSWLYILIIMFLLYGINLSACLIESTFDLFKSSTHRLKQIAALLIHLALLLTMTAHLFDGFYGETQQGVISQDGVLIPGIGHVATHAIETTYHPDGSLKDTKVDLTIVRTNGEQTEHYIAYNEPAIFDNGKWEIIIQSGGNELNGFTIENRSTNQLIYLSVNKETHIDGGTLTLQKMVRTQMGPFAQINWKPKSGKVESKVIALSSSAGRHSTIMLNESQLHFKELTYLPVATVMVRYNPAILLVIFALIISAIGLVMLRPPWRQKNRDGQ